MLLLTATPVQNTRDDLAAQLALFLGRVAWEMSDEALAELVVRDSGSVLGARPRLDGPHRVHAADRRRLSRLAARAAAARRGEGRVGRRGAARPTDCCISGRRVARRSSRRSLAVGRAASRSRAALEAGRRPTRAELSAWAHGGDALQLAFPEIVAAEALDDGFDAQAMLVALDRHGAAIDALLRYLRRSSDPDAERADALLEIRRRHAGERIIAFCQYAETVGMLRARLALESPASRR